MFPVMIKYQASKQRISGQTQMRSISIADILHTGKDIRTSYSVKHNSSMYVRNGSTGERLKQGRDMCSPT